MLAVLRPAHGRFVTGAAQTATRLARARLSITRAAAAAGASSRLRRDALPGAGSAEASRGLKMLAKIPSTHTTPAPDVRARTSRREHAAPQHDSTRCIACTAARRRGAAAKSRIGASPANTTRSRAHQFALRCEQRAVDGKRAGPNAHASMAQAGLASLRLVRTSDFETPRHRNLARAKPQAQVDEHELARREMCCRLRAARSAHSCQASLQRETPSGTARYCR